MNNPHQLWARRRSTGPINVRPLGDGGPWGSGSITAATRWEARRTRMIRALGCDTCGDGAIKPFAGQVLGGKRQGIPIRPDTSTPTRHDRLHAFSDDAPGTPRTRA